MMRTRAEYDAAAMLLGDGWTYDPDDHTLNRTFEPKSIRIKPKGVQSFDPDTLEPLYSTEDGNWFEEYHIRIAALRNVRL